MENNNKSNGNFFSGFLLGVLVGGFLVFLLGTKKGKKLLKAISEEGLDNLSGILEKEDKAVGLDEVYEEEEVAPKKHVIIERDIEEKPKRFFRGISRRVN